jgi:hypothetical protein
LISFIFISPFATSAIPDVAAPAATPMNPRLVMLFAAVFMD